MTKRILAVDDDPDALAMVRMTLKTEGYSVETASSGQAGIDAARANPPDLIILDIMMPDLNGGQVARQLKADPKTSTIPIIMLTGLNERKYIKAALFDLGVDFYIIKPFEPDDLLEKIKEATDGQIAEE